MKETLQQQAGAWMQGASADKAAYSASQASPQAGSQVALTTNQADALNEIIRQLDGSAPRRTIALYGPRGSGKTTLISELLESPRPRRTVLQRKVVGFVADAGLLDTRLAPWIQLVNSVLDKLTELAQPTPPMMIADLKTELRELVRLEMRNDEASRVTSELAAAAFAHHWRSAFPRLLLDIVMQMNAALVVALDHVEQLEPVPAAQLLEAARYFLNAAGCTTVLLADENALIAKLDASGSGIDGEYVLNQWASAKLVLHPSPSGRLNRTANPFGSQLLSSTPAVRDVAHDATTATSPANHADVPGPVLATLRNTGQLDAAVNQWRAAMRAVIRRAQDGGPSSNVGGELMAKVVALRYLHTELFDAARFDAALLVGLERRVGNPRLAEVGNEFDRVVAADEKLKSLFKSQPLFGNIETRDLATALRMAFTEDAAGQLGQPATAPALGTADAVSTGAARFSPVALLQRALPNLKQATQRATQQATSGLLRGMPQRQSASDAVSGQMLPALNVAPNAAPDAATRAMPRIAARSMPSDIPNIYVGLATTLSLAAGTFILDRIIKLAMLGAQPAAEGLLRLDASTLMPANINLLNSGAAIAAELLGVALAALIFVFWGRSNKLYAASLGLMLGAFSANLIDRMAYGAVLNYIHVGQLPTFNLAHVALAGGVILMIVAMLSLKPAQEARAAARN